ncbi:MAG: tRNA (N(6)-L-threonylcarbamoyladenosine(37)-C(2))-methylthiotransferase MtaB [Caulobacteraceae bacterium]
MTAEAQTRRGLEVVGFGCRLNACEGESLQGAREARGFSETVVFNTCAVTGEAVRQARQAIRKARRERPAARIVVTGCAAQIAPEAFAAMAEVDLILGNAEKMRPEVLVQRGPRVRVGDILAERWELGAAGSAAFARGSRIRGYVEIQNGCDHRCTFCVIPFGRGNARSTPAEVVVERVRTLVRAGAVEVILPGVDLTSWGGDLAGGPRLGDLVGKILDEVRDLRRLRLSSIDAAEIDEALLARFAREPRLMPHLHLSLQSGDDLILKRMKRRHSRGQALELIERVRRVRPGIAIGADLIAGFPTETEAAFANSLSLIEAGNIALLHVFPFSARPGTPAERMPQLPARTIRERAAALREAGDEALRRRLESRMGLIARALVERPGQARAEDFTEVAFAGEAEPGMILEGVLSSHDGKRARMEAWRASP